MSEAFDPYRKWLGIPPEEQPPNHYRLLGIALYEDDTDTIHHAADRQMAHLRTFQGGKFSEQSQKLLNEVSSARLCLLDAEKKAAYDGQLKQSLAPPVAGAAAPPATPPMPAAPPPPPAPDAPPPPAPEGPPRATPVADSAAPVTPVVKAGRPRGGSYVARRKKTSSAAPLMIGILCVGGLLVGGLLIAAIGDFGGSTVERPANPGADTSKNNSGPESSPVQRFAPENPSPRRTTPQPLPRETPSPPPSDPPPQDDPPNATTPVNNSRPRTMEEIETEHVRSSLKEVREKLSQREADAARRILDGLEISVEKAGMEAEYEQAKMLQYYLAEFLAALRRGASSMKPGDSFTFHGDTVELVSVDETTRAITYKFNGSEATHTTNEVPTGAAVVLAWKMFERETIDPYAYIYTGTFVLLDGNNELSAGERAAAAKSFWEEAELPEEAYLSKELAQAAADSSASGPPDDSETGEPGASDDRVIDSAL